MNQWQKISLPREVAELFLHLNHKEMSGFRPFFPLIFEKIIVQHIFFGVQFRLFAR